MPSGARPLVADLDFDDGTTNRSPSASIFANVLSMQRNRGLGANGSGDGEQRQAMRADVDTIMDSRLETMASRFEQALGPLSALVARHDQPLLGLHPMQQDSRAHVTSIQSSVGGVQSRSMDFG